MDCVFKSPYHSPDKSKPNTTTPVIHYTELQQLPQEDTQQDNNLASQSTSALELFNAASKPPPSVPGQRCLIAMLLLFWNNSVTLNCNGLRHFSVT